MRSPLARTLALTVALAAAVGVDREAAAEGTFGGATVDVSSSGGEPSDVQGSDGAASGAIETLEQLESALRFAENAFVYGDYPDVVATLEPLLSAPEIPDADRAALVRGHTLLGTAAHFTGREAVADAAFLAALRLEPRLRLDPLVVPPRVIERLEAVRAAHAVELDALIAESTAATTVYVEREVREQSRLVSMLPFGYGFLASERPRPGLAYLVSETALGVGMVSMYLSNEVARDASGFFDNPERARRRGTAQLALASAFCSLVVVNVAHGLATHSDTERVQYRRLSEPPPEISGTDARARGRGWTVRLVPVFAVAR
ncbi:MAG: hypothetical protein H6698_06775 [Myxococcales bacterium]|nr:hypothetical protein [Myxococcales bacterium]MCB9520997.1 hypothetical protein [Myxococcales bacterium]MCB9531676.1 hypothetical protein [Myxococcales bacterium]MCB9534011.1 hypothetical protein [Myxococcales bacterium]